jgi:hypothetical protein
LRKTQSDLIAADLRLMAAQTAISVEDMLYLLSESNRLSDRLTECSRAYRLHVERHGCRPEAIRPSSSN